MRLKDPNQSVPGGFYYVVPETEDVVGTDGNLRKLADTVRGYYSLKSIPIPDYLELLIEDQICERAPSKYCRYGKGIGDILAQGIHGIAGAVDSILGTNLKQKARGCRGCGKRRRQLNQITQNFR